MSTVDVVLLVYFVGFVAMLPALWLKCGDHKHPNPVADWFINATVTLLLAAVWPLVFLGWIFQHIGGTGGRA